MKRFLFVLCALLSNVSNSCNLCWDYKIKDPRLIRENISHEADCTCPCWQYPHTKGDNNFYRCTQCGHRITPPNPLSKNGPQYKRFNNPQGTNNVKPQALTQEKKSGSKKIVLPLTQLKKKSTR